MKIGPVSVRGWNRVSSHFDVWRQPPIMESIIARHSLSFCVPFSMANQAARLSVSRRIQPPLPFLQNPVGHQNLSLSPSLPLFLSVLSVLVGKKKDLLYRKKLLILYRKKRSHGGSIPRKVRPVQVKIHPRVQECRYYRYIIYANYHRRSKSIAETGSQLSVRAYFLRSWPRA